MLPTSAFLLSLLIEEHLSARTKNRPGCHHRRQGQRGLPDRPPLAWDALVPPLMEAAQPEQIAAPEPRVSTKPAKAENAGTPCAFLVPDHDPDPGRSGPGLTVRFSPVRLALTLAGRALARPPDALKPVPGQSSTDSRG